MGMLGIWDFLRICSVQLELRFSISGIWSVFHCCRLRSLSNGCVFMFSSKERRKLDKDEKWRSSTFRGPLMDNEWRHMLGDNSDMFVIVGVYFYAWQ